MEGLEIKDRREYRNIAKGFDLVGAFGSPLDLREKECIRRLFSCVDYVDQILDSRIVSKEEAVTKITRFICSETNLLDWELSSRVWDELYFVKNKVEMLGLGPEVKKWVNVWVLKQQTLCEARTPFSFVEATKLNGRQHVKLPLMFLPNISNKARLFLTQAFIMAELTDNLVDLDEDYQNREIKIKPSLWLRLLLRVHMLWTTLVLGFLYPRKLEAVKLTITFVFYSLRVKKFKS